MLARPTNIENRSAYVIWTDYSQRKKNSSTITIDSHFLRKAYFIKTRKFAWKINHYWHVSHSIHVNEKKEVTDHCELNMNRIVSSISIIHPFEMSWLYVQIVDWNVYLCWRVCLSKNYNRVKTQDKASPKHIWNIFRNVARRWSKNQRLISIPNVWKRSADKCKRAFVLTHTHTADGCCCFSPIRTRVFSCQSWKFV